MPSATIRATDATRPPRTVFATVVEDRPSFRDRALNVAVSVRELGGSLADSDILVCSVDSLDPRTRAALTDLGARIEVVSVFDERNRRSNKLRVLEVLAGDDYDHVVSIDSDVIVCRDIAGHLTPDSVGLTPASLEALPDEEWDRLFAVTGVDRPRRCLIAQLTGDRLYPYYNSGVVLVPGDLVAPLHAAWARAERELLDLADEQPGLLHRWAHLNQFGLMVALLRTGIPVHVLPYEMNLHTSATAAPGSPADGRFEPYVLHYHNKIDARGFVRRTPTPGTAEVIERFNEARSAHTGQSPPPTRWDRALDARRLAGATRRLLPRTSR